MSSFTTPLIVTPLADGKHWELIEPFEYHVGSKESNEIITVPKGYVTNFASIPQIFWNILPPVGTYGKAAVIHDWLYQNNGKIVLMTKSGNYWLVKQYTRKQCDDIFLEAMVVLKTGRLARWMIYSHVRWWGWIVWNNYMKIAKKTA